MAVFSVHNNVSSLRAQRHVGATQGTLNQTLQRLSSGFRINGAQDDAAGLGVSENLRAQVRGLAVAERNAADGNNIVQTAESALGEVTNILQRMREIGVQAATDGIGSTERGFLDAEFQKLASEIDRVTAATKYNGTSLLAGGFSTGKSFKVGAGTASSDAITVSIGKLVASTLQLTGRTVSTLAKANTAITKLDAAITTLNTRRAKLGAAMSNFGTAQSHASVMRENLAAAESRIRDTDIAQETSQFARSQVLMQAGVSMLAQANAQPSIALRLLG